jgi:uncharacterized membrane protein HdeD (DUF308 family)
MTSTHPDEGRATRTDTGRRRAEPSMLAAAVDSFPSWLVIAYGAVTAALGVAMLVWPDKTLLVVVAIFAAQLFLAGLLQLVRAVMPRTSGGGERVLLAVSGGLALLAALLILRRPLQTLVIVTLLVGAWWIVQGVMDLVGAMLGTTASRGWSLALGVLDLLAGGFVLLNPGMSLLVFVWISGVWMIAAGITLVVACVRLRRAPTGAAAPAPA